MSSGVPLQKVSLTHPVAESPVKHEQKAFLWDVGNLSMKLFKKVPWFVCGIANRRFFLSFCFF